MDFSEILDPLTEERNQINRELARLDGERRELLQQRKTVERVLRAAGLSAPKARKPSPSGTQVSPGTMQEIENWCLKQTEPFTKSDAVRGTGRSQYTVHQAIMELRGKSIRALTKRGNTIIYAPMSYDA